MKNIKPHCTFRIAKLDDIFYMLQKVVEDKTFDGLIYQVYPELQTIPTDLTVDEKRRVLRDFFGKILDEKYKTIEESTHLFQKEWNLVEDKAMGALEKLIEQKWSREDFEVRVSINPVCPRNLDSGSFDIFYRISVDRMIAVSMHELLHFIYFSKFKELFPEISKEEYNRPHLAWHLSEIVPGVILNDIKMQEVFAYRHKSYRRYYEIIIEGYTLMEHIQKMYDSRTDFEDFVRKAWKFVKENEKVIKD